MFSAGKSGGVEDAERGSSPCLRGSAPGLGTRGHGDSSPRSPWCPAPAWGGSWGRRQDAGGVVTTPWEPAARLFCNCSSLLRGGVFFLLFAPISNPQETGGNPPSLQAPGTALHVPKPGGKEKDGDSDRVTCTGADELSFGVRSFLGSAVPTDPLVGLAGWHSIFLQKRGPFAPKIRAKMCIGGSRGFQNLRREGVSLVPTSPGKINLSYRSGAWRTTTTSTTARRSSARR